MIAAGRACERMLLLLLLSMCGSGSQAQLLTALPHDLHIQVGHNQSVQLQLLSSPYDFDVWWHEDSAAVQLTPNPSPIARGNASTARLHIHALSVSEVTLLAANCTRQADPRNCTVDLSRAFVRVSVVHSVALQLVISIVGWLYFVAWSISFYPQIVLNFRRKSVLGLNFDFVSLNIVGFACYSVYNCVLYWHARAQWEYEAKFGRHAVIPVQLNDVIFALHAAAATAFTILQCLVYESRHVTGSFWMSGCPVRKSRVMPSSFERGGQRVSQACRALLGVFALFVAANLALFAFDVVNELFLIEMISYVKLTVTIVKYVPQAVMNWRRRSTQGWSIGNVLLDFTGGSLSLLQMGLIAYNTDDWTGIFGDLTKFGLGLFSLLFDVLFIVQHYVLYAPDKQPAAEDGDAILPVNDDDDDDDEGAVAHNYGATQVNS